MFYDQNVFCRVLFENKETISRLNFSLTPIQLVKVFLESGHDYSRKFNYVISASSKGEISTKKTRDRLRSIDASSAAGESKKREDLGYEELDVQYHTSVSDQGGNKNVKGGKRGEIDFQYWKKFRFLDGNGSHGYIINWTILERGLSGKELVKGPDSRIIVQDTNSLRKDREEIIGQLVHTGTDPVAVSYFPEYRGVEERTLASIKSRRGQRNFRANPMVLYSSKCAITGCPDEAVLEAAHLVLHAVETNYSVTNGILLRSDIHTLFDLHLISIEPKTLQICASRRLVDPVYRNLDLKRVTLPPMPEDRPSNASLQVHFDLFQSKDF